MSVLRMKNLTESLNKTYIKNLHNSLLTESEELEVEDYVDAIHRITSELVDEYYEVFEPELDDELEPNQVKIRVMPPSKNNSENNLFRIRFNVNVRYLYNQTYGFLDFVDELEEQITEQVAPCYCLVGDGRDSNFIDFYE